MIASLLFKIRYYSLISLLSDLQLNSSVNRTQVKALRMVYGDALSIFTTLLQRDTSASIRLWYLQLLAKKVYKRNLDPF